jgi:hypothetical protein
MLANGLFDVAGHVAMHFVDLVVGTADPIGQFRVAAY